MTLSRVAGLATIVFFGLLPVLTVVVLFASAVDSDSIAIDFRQFYAAAQAITEGESPYRPSGPPLTEWGGPYPYPPLPALVAIPLTGLPLDAAGLLAMGVLVVVALAVLYVLGVRDWRCYGVAIMWPPVVSAVQTSNLTLWLALACALVWRFRDRVVPTATILGISLAAKFFLWPLVVWLAATRRAAGALLACASGVAFLLASWGVIGFAGMADYPDLLHDLERLVGDDSYTLYIVGTDAGLPSPVARVLWLLGGLALVAWVVRLGRRGDERSSFIVAIGAALALTPIVWLHYFALLLVVAALSRPRLGAVWFVPFAMIITPGSGHPTPFQTVWTLSVAALTFVLAVRASRASGESVTAEPSTVAA